MTKIVQLSQKEHDTLQYLINEKFIYFMQQTPIACAFDWEPYLNENKIKRLQRRFFSENSTEPIIELRGVILSSPSSDEYLLVPFDFAEKTLVLGFLP